MKYIVFGVLGLLAVLVYDHMPVADPQADALRTWNFAAASQENRKLMLDELHREMSTGLAKEQDWNSEFKLQKSEVLADKLSITFAFQLQNEDPKIKRLNREQRLKFDGGFLQAFCTFYASGKGRHEPVRFDVSIDHVSEHQIYHKAVVQSMCKNKKPQNQLGLRSNTI